MNERTVGPPVAAGNQRSSLDSSKENPHTAGQDGFLRDLRRQTTPMGDRLRGPGNSLVAARGHGCVISWRTVLPRSPVMTVSAGSVSGEVIVCVAADGSAKRTGAATAAVLARWG